IQGNTLAPAPQRYAAPWARSDTPGYFDGGNKFDLTRWDEAYFERLKDFVGQAGNRGIVVEVVLFCTMYSEKLWKVSPMHVANNINGIGKVGQYEVYGLKEDALTEAQAAATRKIVRELNPSDNVYYEICNEPYERGGMHPDWQRRMITTIRETEMSLPNQHLISLNFAHGSAEVAEPHPNVSIYNFHAAKPEAVTLNYGLRKAIGHNETGGSRRDDATYRIQGWEFILAGGALFSHLDFSFATTHPRGTLLDHRGPGGGGPAIRQQLRVLKEFIHSFEFVRMKPDNSVIKGGVPEKGRAWALIEPGRACAIYLVGNGPNELTLELPKGAFRAEWINTLDGSIGKTENFTHGGGPRQLQSPNFDQDIALRIKAK
ncbi:MAG: cellulase family glycosylhydrolase, partial [Sedimentisphaerales bacterium]|nr:cellulase family glycosylhydrolase [Sedimentisphaerales bacterium]